MAAGELKDKIKSVLVLMLENRSFDHIFGAMPGVDGLLGPVGELKDDVYNTMHPESDPDAVTKPKITIPKIWPAPITPETQKEVVSHDFNHNFADGMLFDLFGPSVNGIVGGAPVEGKRTWPADMAGFASTIAWNADSKGHIRNGPSSMSYFKWTSLKVMHQLAQDFVVCDNWHCDVPGQTWVNRVFLHCAQSGGVLADDGAAPMANLDSIYDLLKQHGRTWKMYARADHCDTEYLNTGVNSKSWSPDNPYQTNVTRVRFSQLKNDIQHGQLPDFGFIMCWDLPHPDEGDTSMHPYGIVNGGENLIASIYNLLRHSPSWENTLFIVTFDENGGMYDHKRPPAAPSPVDPPIIGFFDDQNSTKQVTFDFTLLGPRVPALLISPWLRHGIDFDAVPEHVGHAVRGGTGRGEHRGQAAQHLPDRARPPGAQPVERLRAVRLASCATGLPRQARLLQGRPGHRMARRPRRTDVAAVTAPFVGHLQGY